MLIIELIYYQVPHFHLHIFPRKAGDWENNDDIHKDLENNERQPRSQEEMTKEADFLRKFFKSDDIEIQ